MKPILLIALCLFSASLVRGQNWPQFRGPNATGVVEGRAAATNWNVEKSENVRWKTPIPGLDIPVR